MGDLDRERMAATSDCLYKEIWRRDLNGLWKCLTETALFHCSVLYRQANKGLYVLLSRTQAGPGRTVKQEQEEISRNHVQTFISPSVHI